MARPVLKKGMSGKAGTEVGDAIYLWRNFIGLPPAAGVKVFDFGTQSHDRTVAWQKQQRLSSTDGKVGPESWGRYDSLQYGPPTAAAAAAATQAATALKQQVEAPAPAAVQAAESIKKKIPAPKPSTAATTAAAKIAAPTKPPAPAVTMPKSLEEARATTVAVTKEVIKQVEGAPLWLRITGSTVGVVLAIKGLRKLFGV